MTTPEDSGRETQVVTIGDRSIVLRKLTDAQRTLVGRWASMLTRSDVDGAQKLSLIDKMFTTLESVIVQQTDRDFVEDLMARGEMDLKTLHGFVTAFDQPSEPGARPSKVRRGRAATSR